MASMDMAHSATPDPQRQRRARRYARLRRRLGLLELLLFAAYLGAWLALRLGPGLQGWLNRTWGPSPWWLELMAVAVAMGLLWQPIGLPLDYCRSFILPHRFGLSNQTLAGWLADTAKSMALTTCLGGAVLLGLYALMRATPSLWWLWAGLGYSLLTAVLTTLAPVLILPIFFKQRPLGEEHAALRQRLMELAQRAGTQVEGVYSLDMSRRTKTANAGLVGMGRTRRILLGDTLLQQFEPQEIEVVLAHELGHHAQRDIPLFIIVQTGLNLLLLLLAARGLPPAAAALGLASPADPAGLPLLIAMLGGLALLAIPLGNAFSRWRERLADDFALRLTANPRAFIQAMVRLADLNLAEADPERWVVLLLASHPPIGDRIRAARAFMTRTQGLRVQGS